MISTYFFPYTAIYLNHKLVKFMYSENFVKSSPYFWLSVLWSNVRSTFHKILWPQNISTLLSNKYPKQITKQFLIWRPCIWSVDQVHNLCLLCVEDIQINISKCPDHDCGKVITQVLPFRKWEIFQSKFHHCWIQRKVCNVWCEES